MEVDRFPLRLHPRLLPGVIRRHTEAHDALAGGESPRLRVSDDDDAVVTGCTLDRHVPVANVPQDSLGLPLVRVAPAAPAVGEVTKHRVRRRRMGRLPVRVDVPATHLRGVRLGIDDSGERCRLAKRARADRRTRRGTVGRRARGRETALVQMRRDA